MELMFEEARLDALVSEHRTRYLMNEPFPHVVIDDFLPSRVAETVAARFPTPQALPWRSHDSDHEIKLDFRDETRVDECIREVLFQLNAGFFLQFLGRLTEITGLISDPYLEGGGLHQIERGGFLNVHADFNYHSKLRLRRQLNLLIYFNPNWKEEYGGHLELWDREMKSCVRKIMPAFNRCVIFNTTEYSYHGHPEPLRCPPGMTRRSLALYYYTNDGILPEQQGRHSTLFHLRPGEDTKAKVSQLRRVKRLLLLCVPPIVWRVYERLRFGQDARS